ncbi:hypothetical protein PRIPAC_83179 [Pristionchus pacificus]|uniref:C2H2-type domain-containing protein n=1 Tax=Pristionchus pacificus TaxID=54126 RepID=A0A2A6BMQ0_PRIPA|nr:hypothetical protein PRIPAC_83179 [Pristionchus pacificus]|eukprot:PDM67169.1 hypothetical protein PRIPAC_48586 [Pristionchus pacificus]
MSSSIDLSNDLMNIQYEISEFASIDHLGSVWLNGLEMMMELTNKGADSQEFNKAVESFTKSIRQNKNRDEQFLFNQYVYSRNSDPLRNAGYEFCDAISLAFNDLSKKAKEKQIKKQIALIRPVQQSQSSKATRETRSSKKKTIFLERRFEENVAQPIEPLRLLRCGDCPAIFKSNTARLEHRKIHAKNRMDRFLKLSGRFETAINAEERVIRWLELSKEGENSEKTSHPCKDIYFILKYNIRNSDSNFR